jgi:hypothetical protein
VNAPERKYVFTKLAFGDYLLPSNDGHALWRLRRYWDGPSQGLDWPRDRAFWGLWRWLGDPHDHVAITASIENSDDGDRWEIVESLLPSRRAAIEAALRRQP